MAMTRPAAERHTEPSAPNVDRTALGGIRPAPRGHHSFDAAFREALRVTDCGVLPREIRVRRNPGGDSYTWSVRY